MRRSGKWVGRKGGLTVGKRCGGRKQGSAESLCCVLVGEMVTEKELLYRG